MLTRPFGKTGLSVSVLALGAGRLGELSIQENDVEALLRRALDLGVVLIDAARGYGAAEDRLGRMLSGQRDRVLLSTKIGYGIPGHADWTGPCITAGIDAALERFRTDRLDVVHLHSCGLDVLQRGEVVDALRRGVEAGKVRVAAYSGEGEALDWAVRSGAFGSVQCSVSALDQANLRGGVAEAARRGIGVLAKRSLGNAPWRFDTRPAATDVALYWDRLHAMGLDARDPSLFDTFLRFSAFSPGVSAVLVGTASAAHLEAAARAVERGPLSDSAQRALTDAFARAGASWGGQIRGVSGVSEARLRVGVVGTSWWVELEHLPGLRARGDVDIVALCGRSPERLALVAARQGVSQTFTDWREMIARAGLDAVVIATPNVLHHPIASAAIDAGLHVICEKPLAMTVAQAREMASRAEVAGRKTMTFFTFRAVAAAAHIRQLVQEGFLGRPLHVSASYFTASNLQPGVPLSWRMRREEAGTGALGDIASHIVDLVRWWLGDVTRVCGQWQTVTHPRSCGVADTDEDCSFLAQLACGAQAVFQASKLVPGRGNHQRIELSGTEGTLIFEAETGFEPSFEGRVYVGRADRFGVSPLQLPAELKSGLNGPDEQANRNEAYRRLTDPFFRAVRHGGAVSPDFGEGAAVQAVLDAVAASAERRAWVEI